MKSPVIAVLAAAFLLQSAFRAHAQDVTVGEPVWAGPEAAPDEMPKVKGRLRPEFPEELRKTAEPGYVILTRSIDASGKASAGNLATTHVPLRQAVVDATRDWGFSNAKRGGQPVETRVWVGVIFNPKSAAVKGPDATPRLVSVTPIYSAEHPAPSGKPPTVAVKLGIDATGLVTHVKSVVEIKPALADAIEAAVKTWHFAPARKAGQPVESEIETTVVCQQPVHPNASKMVPPKRLGGEMPVYPIAMRRFGIGGQVIISVEIDSTGKVLNPTIAESDNPAFDEPALKAVLGWKFQPATSDGKPYKMRVAIPVVFQVDGRAEKLITQSGSEPDQSKLPAELRYDIPAKFRGILLPVHPYAARETQTFGKASVAMMINPQGRVIDVKVIAADRPDFGMALAAAAEGFRFDPAYKDGKPVPHLLRFEYEFSRPNMSSDDYDLMALEKKSAELIIGSSRLDSPLVPLSRRPPVFPVRLPKGVSEGQATIEFIVDKEGRARLPRVVSATDEAFGYSGVQAVSTWLFTPPLVAGKKTLTRVQVPLVFSVKKTPPAKAQPPQDAKAEEAKPADLEAPAAEDSK